MLSKKQGSRFTVSMRIFKGLTYLLMNFVILFVACININGVT